MALGDRISAQPRGVTVPEDETRTIGYHLMDGDIGVNAIDNLICRSEEPFQPSACWGVG